MRFVFLFSRGAIPILKKNSHQHFSLSLSLDIWLSFAAADKLCHIIIIITFLDTSTCRAWITLFGANEWKLNASEWVRTQPPCINQIRTIENKNSQICRIANDRLTWYIFGLLLTLLFLWLVAGINKTKWKLVCCHVSINFHDYVPTLIDKSSSSSNLFDRQTTLLLPTLGRNSIVGCLFMDRQCENERKSGYEKIKLARFVYNPKWIRTPARSYIYTKHSCISFSHSFQYECRETMRAQTMNVSRVECVSLRAAYAFAS